MRLGVRQISLGIEEVDSNQGFDQLSGAGLNRAERVRLVVRLRFEVRVAPTNVQN